MRWVYLGGGWEVEVWLVGQVGWVVLWSSLSCGAVFVFVRLRPGAKNCQNKPKTAKIRKL